MKKRALSVVCLVSAGSALGALLLPPRGGRLFSRRSRSRRAADEQQAIAVERVARRFLLYFIVPVWLAAELLDYFCHRKTHIESTAGAHESLLHSVLAAQIALPVMNGLFLRANPLSLLLMIGSFVTHTATGLWDVAYAEGRRTVTETEQHAHSALEMVPYTVTSLMIALYPDQALKLARANWEPGDFTLRPKRQPLSGLEVLALASACATCVALPYAEELWRCYRASKTLAPLPPEHAARPQA